jgi:hypothetical protein
MRQVPVVPALGQNSAKSSFAPYTKLRGTESDKRQVAFAGGKRTHSSLVSTQIHASPIFRKMGA